MWEWILAIACIIILFLLFRPKRNILDPNDLKSAEFVITLSPAGDSGTVERYQPEVTNKRIKIDCSLTLPDTIVNLDKVDAFSLTLKNISQPNYVTNTEWAPTKTVSTLFTYDDFQDYNLLDSELVVKYTIKQSSLGYREWGSILLDTSELSRALDDFETNPNTYRVKVPITLATASFQFTQDTTTSISIREKLFKFTFNPDEFDGTESFSFVGHIRKYNNTSQNEIEFINCYPPDKPSCQIPDITQQGFDFVESINELDEVIPNTYFLKSGSGAMTGFDGTQLITTHSTILREDFQKIAYSTVKVEEIIPVVGPLYRVFATTNDTIVDYLSPSRYSAEEGVSFTCEAIVSDQVYIRLESGEFPFKDILGVSDITGGFNQEESEIIKEILNYIYYTNQSFTFYSGKTSGGDLLDCDVTSGYNRPCHQVRTPTVFKIREYDSSSDGPELRQNPRNRPY